MNPPQTEQLLGVDTGGTFTDLVQVADGKLRCYKLPSTPHDPGEAVAAGVRFLLGEQRGIIFHGSTVATNALLEHKGASVLLITTAGFADLLLIGRQQRPKLYALQPQLERQALPREAVIEAEERLAADGRVITALSKVEIRRIVSSCLARNVSSVAVTLLHSYANPSHELELGKALRQAGLQVSLSSEILPEYREFERASTTVVNAMVSPIMTAYLEKLKTELAPSPLKVMQSNGGSISSATAGHEAVRTILSGPAGGMVGAFHLAGMEGCERIMTFDMGGTSTDVALCNGQIPTTSETVIADWPVKVPMIDIHTVGAGGGSLARLDAGGALRVGPESAGADPGPACYGRGEQATVTDANLYMGRLLPDRFLGGRMALDAGRGARTIEALAQQAGLAPERLAEGLLEIAEETMAGALRVVSVERGHDPREFTLLPFGGAGGLHACALAEKLSIEQILFPPFPGLLSALGMVISHSIRDYSHSVLLRELPNAAEFAALYQPLEQQGRQELAREGLPPERMLLERSVDLRYRGQSYEITIPWGDGLIERFHQAHRQLYGYADHQRAIEIVTLRLRAVGLTRPPAFELAGDDTPAAGEPGSCRLWLDGEQINCPVYERQSLRPGGTIAGPALIVEDSATLLLRPGWHARVTANTSLLAERGRDGRS